MKIIFTLIILVSCVAMSDSNINELQLLEKIDGVNISVFKNEELGWRKDSKYYIEYCNYHKCIVFLSNVTSVEMLYLLTDLTIYTALYNNYSNYYAANIFAHNGIDKKLKRISYHENDSEKVVKNKLRKKILELLENDSINAQLKTYDDGEYTLNLTNEMFEELLDENII